MLSRACLAFARKSARAAFVLCIVAGVGVVPAEATYIQNNLVTDNQAFLTSQGFTPAAFVDQSLVNPWGVSFSATGPFWVSNQGSANSTLYNTAGSPQALVVSIPQSATGPRGPTGQAFNGANTFNLSNGQRGVFFFANLDGSIAGWNPGLGSNAQTVVSAASANRAAVYTGLAIGASGGQNFLYAANNATGRIDVFNSSFAPAALAGTFTDPGPNPNNLSPFNVANIGGQIYVTYATPGPSADEAPAGRGFVSVFNTDGTFVRRIVDEGGQTTSPWGVAIAPANFAELSGALLVANFHESLGFIRAYDRNTGAFLGTLTGENGGDVNIPYLWAILFGNGGNGGVANRLYFAAGIGDEQHGLFGEFVATPLPAAAPLFLGALVAAAAATRRARTLSRR